MPALKKCQIFESYLYLITPPNIREENLSEFAEVLEEIVDKEIISNVELFDVYIEGVGKGKKSLAVKVTLQPTEATMTEKEIEIISDKILASVANQTGGNLRS